MWPATNNRYAGNRILALIAAPVALARVFLSDRCRHHGFLHALRDLGTLSSGGAFMLVFVSAAACGMGTIGTDVGTRG